MSRSTQATLSWLTLERYALGELDEATRCRVEAQLSASEADREALRTIQEDVRELPPLPVLPFSDAGGAEVVVLPSRRRRVGLWLSGLGLAAAAAVLLSVRLPADLAMPPAHRHLKGGELSLRVISERGGDALGYQAGERLKLMLTCPPSLGGTLEAVIFQGGERHRPLPSGAQVACGNGVAWPGAFALDGTADAHACIADAQAVAHALRAADLAQVGVCVRLRARE